MPYQFSGTFNVGRTTRLSNACTNAEKRLAGTLLDIGLRVSELATFTKDNLDWQMHLLMIYGKGLFVHH